MYDHLLAQNLPNSEKDFERNKTTCTTKQLAPRKAPFLK
jgi:hypothetical protein